MSDVIHIQRKRKVDEVSSASAFERVLAALDRLAAVVATERVEIAKAFEDLTKTDRPRRSRTAERAASMISIKEAAFRVGRSEKTIHRWSQRYDLGVEVIGLLTYIDPAKLEAVAARLDTKIATWREKRRTHCETRRTYFSGRRDVKSPTTQDGDL